MNYTPLFVLVDIFFIKVNAEKHHSFSIEPINCTTNSTNLMHLGILYSRICDEERIFHSLINSLISNGFCITNLTLVFMVSTNKNLCKSKAMVKNNLGTHTSLGLTFLGWQRANLRIIK
jgi:hypothetical protein